jgi:hypothetical protein
MRVDWIVELQQLLDRTVIRVQQGPVRRPDSGLNSPGLEEETSDYHRGRDTVQVQYQHGHGGRDRSRPGVLDRETLNSLRGTIDLLVSEDTAR